MNYLFAYGTLLDKNIQVRVFGHEVQGHPDQLADYRRVIRNFVCGSYPDIIFESGSLVSGMILELTDNELEQCDRYEGDEYERVSVVLKNGSKAFVYKGKQP
jgi:gamma-glutamylcyclotransferase (GGCT)/AIG2-like uncharacterized protein YtfP